MRNAMIAKLVIAMSLLSGVWHPASAERLGLYQAQAVVSGQAEDRRAIGFSLCLRDVLVKVSGDQTVLDDPRMADIARSAGGFIESFDYRDLLSGIPLHDEQGSYDRPHYLTCTFEVARIDAVLERLGRKAWLGPRPAISVVLGVRDMKGSTNMLAVDGAEGREADMRASLATAADRVGLTVKLPDNAALKNAGLSFAQIAAADDALLDAAAKAEGGGVALAGTLEWSDAALGWVADWRMTADRRSYRWQVRGVGFDDAFRNAMNGAAQVLSGHGRPAGEK